VRRGLRIHASRLCCSAPMPYRPVDSSEDLKTASGQFLSAQSGINRAIELNRKHRNNQRYCAATRRICVMSVSMAFRPYRYLFLLCTSCGPADSRPPQSPPSIVVIPKPAPSSKAVELLSNRSLAPEVIQKIVRSNFGAMRKCYEDGLRKDPNLAGTVSVRFVIALDGRVSSAHDIHDSPPPNALERKPEPLEERLRFPDQAVVDCVVSAFAALTFPHPKNGIVTVVYPIVFSPSP
jgi:hypothetical protein